MAAGKLALIIWLGFATLLWTLHPLLFSQARGIQLLTALTGLLAMLGWFSSAPVFTFWSAVTGLINVTLALVLTAHPPNLWLGLSTGLLLFALLDGQQRWAYVRHCQLEPGMASAMLEPFLYVSVLATAVGLAVGSFLVALHDTAFNPSYVGLLTITGAALFAGALTLFLLYTNRLSGD